MNTRTLREGQVFNIAYSRRGTRSRPAINKVLTCIVVYLNDENGNKVPFLRSDQFGIYWFRPHQNPRGGFGYKAVDPENAGPLEALFLKKQNRKAMA